MITQDKVLQALKGVMDPDLNRDIVSLGFVKNISINDGHVEFTIELTTPACPVKERFKTQCEEIIRKLDGVQTVKVNMTAQTGRKMTGAANGNLLPDVKSIIAVASGKGGVGKSTVATNIAVALGQLGANVGLLDADIYGPSIPLMMGVKEAPEMNRDKKLIPLVNHGIKMMSIGFLLPDNEALVWRGPMVANALTQLMSDVNWGELDYLVVDLPPGTGDAQLTLSQVVPLTGAVIVTTPQDVALMDAKRGIGMFQKVNVPILGIIENMSYFMCPNCNHRTEIFSYGGAKKACESFDVPFLGEIPLDIETRLAGDNGKPVVIAKPETANAKAFFDVAKRIASMVSILQHGTEDIKMKSLGQKVFFANTKLKVI
jgi:ATP-binding protein involved in chromosome partitioning